MEPSIRGMAAPLKCLLPLRVYVLVYSTTYCFIIAAGRVPSPYSN